MLVVIAIAAGVQVKGAAEAVKDLVYLAGSEIYGEAVVVQIDDEPSVRGCLTWQRNCGKD